jgi:hypothetical protein
LKEQITQREAPVFLSRAFYYPIFPVDFEPMFANITKEFGVGLFTVVHFPLGIQRNRMENLSPILSVLTSEDCRG